jgi:TolB-like protein
MKESYPDDIMLCFVQGFGDGEPYSKSKPETSEESNVKSKKKNKRASLPVCDEETVELRSKKGDGLLREISQQTFQRLRGVLVIAFQYSLMGLHGGLREAF